MVHRRFASRHGSRLLAVAVPILLVTIVTAYGTNLVRHTAQAEDAKKTVAAETDPDYAVPEGSPDEIMAFVKQLQLKRPKFANREEQIDHAVKVQRAMIAAGDAILKQEPDDKVTEQAVAMKLGSLIMLAANDIPGAGQEALTAVTLMKQDANQIVASAAAEKWTTVRILNAQELNDADRSALAEEVLTKAEKKKFDRAVMPEVMQLGKVLEASASPQVAAAYYNKIADLAEHQGTPALRDVATRMRGTARRAGLLGSTMEIEAKRLDGEQFDWAAYRGKVVLVDFWATWCGPCIAELPNVKANYKKFHEQGFDVVGISLDRSREPLDKFIEKEELPWTQLYDEELQKGTGWNHPVAQHYGISGIPSAFLVGKDGKVVSLKARGPELGRLLEQLLGKAE